MDQLQREGLFGPYAQMRFDDSVGKAALVDELIAELDAAANPNVTAYVPPGTPMSKVAHDAVKRLEWDK